MEKKINIKFGSSTHVGLKRQDNQDYYGKFPEDNLDLTSPKGQLFIVADGMGGHQGGQQASQMVVNIVPQVYFSDTSENISNSLQQAFKSANEQIYQKASSDPNLRGMGTTCTALVLKNTSAYIAHVGDSRVYRVNRDKIEQLTEDHSKVAELQRQGILTEEEAKHHPERSILYRALGVNSTVEIDIREEIHLSAGEYFLLCTDGLSQLENHEIRDIILSNLPQKSCDKLIQLANRRGGDDNVTTMVIRINGADTITGKFLSLMGKKG
jgi:protein phosphatase